MMKHIIVGTAGHIDHGKTALIRALTGTDTDRLKEEQQRGITIDLGFAFLKLPQNIDIGIIDVPGHEKFVKNMLAGIGSIDLVMLVIAADEGIMPQTQEHLDICNLLQIKRGLVVVTKTDLVDDEWRDMVEDVVREELAGTFLQDAPILPVSSKTGEGVDDVRNVLATLAEQVEARSAQGIFRLPVDRVFTIKGFGTVVTGTLISGTVKTEDTVELLPSQITTRVRHIQVHDTTVPQASAGQRTALNLHGLEKKTIERGAVVCEPGLLQPTFMLDAWLTLTPHAPKPLKYRTRIRFHHGTNEMLGRVILFDREELLPGEGTYVQFRLEKPLVAMARDRYIIRSYSPILTIGGGEILCMHPQKHKRSSPVLNTLRILKDGSLDEVLEVYAAQSKQQPITARSLAGQLAVSETAIRQGVERLIASQKVVNTSEHDIAVIHRTHYDRLVADLLEVMTRFHAQNPLKPGISKEELRKKTSDTLSPQLFQQILSGLVEEGILNVDGKVVRRSTHRLELSDKQRRIKQQLEEIYRHAQFQPPNRKDALQQTGFAETEAQEILDVLIHDGTLMKVDQDMYYHHDVLQDMTQTITTQLKQHHEITIGDVKQMFQISRKYTVPLLAHFDATGLTIRKGDVRVLRNEQ